MMAKKSTLISTTSFMLLALAMLLLSAFFVLSDVSPVFAGAPADLNAPGCLTYVPVAGDPRIKVIVRDTESGMASASVFATKNVAGVDVPTFSAGTTDGQTFTGDVDVDSSNAKLGVRATDMVGNTVECVGSYVAPLP